MTHSSSWLAMIPRQRVAEMTHDRALSAHFNEREFVCKCGGKFPGCPREVMNLSLIRALEKYRAAFAPKGLVIVSGYRCLGYNIQINGAKQSQHLYGCAADIPPKATAIGVRQLKCFSGIGIQHSTGLVIHVDVRHLGTHNTKGYNGGSKASPLNPAIWYYD